MKILAIAPEYFISSAGFTGDATQMFETVAALETIPGIEISCAFYSNPSSLHTKDGKKITWEYIHENFDIIHLFKMLPKGYESMYSELTKMPTLVSTVYWWNWRRDLINYKNGGNPLIFIRTISNILRRYIGLKSRRLEKWCCGILPNTWAEGECFKKTFALQSHCICTPVPNATSIPFDLSSLSRPECLPKSDYIVFPGAFALRKNQLGLIEAMAEENIPIVFMGKPLQSDQKYYEKCLRKANKNMYFIGFKDYHHPEYWAILKHARCAVLSSDCETPGIALIEAAIAGARPIVTIQGGTQEYYGIIAEYLDPVNKNSITNAVKNAWVRGRLNSDEAASFRKFTWEWTADITVQAYKKVLKQENNQS